jgi:hypothetical protein
MGAITTTPRKRKYKKKKNSPLDRELLTQD